MFYGSACYHYHVFSQTHLKEECQQLKILCSNDGCSEEITRSQLDDHLQQCQYTRRQSFQWCKEDVPKKVNTTLIHLIIINCLLQEHDHEVRCNHALEKNPNGYSNAVSRRQVSSLFINEKGLLYIAVCRLIGLLM